jgi:uncharacterized protein (DUF1810 family)
MPTDHQDSRGSGDPFNLGRFVAAQAALYADVVDELSAGRKRTHWIWFIFPQCAGLGSSRMSRRFAIGSLDEARAYLAHPVLGPRLVACTTLVVQHAERSAEEIFGALDARKFGSSMTLFAAVAGTDSAFAHAITTHCAGERDAETLRLLGIP